MKRTLLCLLVLVLFCGLYSDQIKNQPDKEDESTSYLKDRDQEIPTSMFGTYINKGELLIYPYFEYFHDHNYEYTPEEFGYNLDKDFRGRYRGYEGLFFLGYGLTSNIAIEFEVTMIDAILETSPDDPTEIPKKISESGLGDVQMQINWLWRKETVKQAGFFSYAEIIFPFVKDKKLIGTQNWEFMIGTGVIRGFSWGTMVVRAALAFELEESTFDIAEVAIEYLKRLSPHWKVYLAVEGTQDEVEFITEFQWHISKKIFIKLNNAFGVTSKATDWAPEIGIMFRF